MPYHPWRDMEEGFWSFLALKDQYAALGLHEFRTYDGHLLPWDPKDGQWPQELLPAIQLELEGPLKRLAAGEGEDVSHSQAGYDFGIECAGLLVFPGPRREPIEHAADTLRRLMDSRRAIDTHLGSDFIGDYSFEIDDVRSIPTRANRGIAAFWQAGITLKLWERERVPLP